MSCLLPFSAGRLAFWMVLATCWSGTATVQAASSPPNFVVIVTDDQGYHDVGFNGSRDIPTPNLDSIAINGVRFTSGYVSAAISSPSRAGLMTGCYSQRFGYDDAPHLLPGDESGGLPLNQVTLAEALHTAGYQCGIIGKWDLGTQPKFRPLKRGFDYFFGFLGPAACCLPEELTNEVSSPIKSKYEFFHFRPLRNDQSVWITNYLTDEFSEEAVRFIGKNKAKPFFLYLAYNAPHGPLEAPEKYLSRFPYLQSQHRKTYAAMISAVDEGVGRVLAELRAAGLERQTVVVFLSATGGALADNSSDNYPLRGGKGGPWEGGWRVPFAMQWPGHLPQGVVYDQPVISLDLFATMVALAGVTPNATQPIDGVDLIPYLTGLKAGAPHDALYLSVHPQEVIAVRGGDYKLVIPGPGQPAELFNLKQDIAETRNLAGAEPAVFAELEQKRIAWTRQLAKPAGSEHAPPKEPKGED